MIVRQYINKLNVRSPFAYRSLASDLVNVKRRERFLFHNVLVPTRSLSSLVGYGFTCDLPVRPSFRLSDGYEGQEGVSNF